jgi:hypothetical protein
MRNDRRMQQASEPLRLGCGAETFHGVGRRGAAPVRGYGDERSTAYQLTRLLDRRQSATIA